MPRYAKDPGLNLLASELKNIKWNDPLDATELETAHTLATSRDARRRLVVPLPTMVHWAVRIYLGGEQRCLGVVHHNDVASAFRFADMAQQHFWKYRVRGCAPPSHRDLNYDEDRLNHDMAHEDGALALLKQMEEHFLKIGALKDTETRAAEMRKKKAERRNMSTIIRMNQVEINERMDGLSKTLEAVAAVLQKLVDNQSRFSSPPPTVAGPCFSGETPAAPSWEPQITCAQS